MDLDSLISLMSTASLMTFTIVSASLIKYRYTPMSSSSESIILIILIIKKISQKFIKVVFTCLFLKNCNLFTTHC